jgi:hypothetical protein
MAEFLTFLARDTVFPNTSDRRAATGRRGRLQSNRMPDRNVEPASGPARRTRPVGGALLAHALLVLGGLVVGLLALAAAEAVTRWWEPGYLVRTRGLHVYSKRYGWAGRPGAVAAMGGGRATLNAGGFRGRELPATKAAGGTRLVVLGDSVAFGYGVSDEEAFPRLIDVRDNGIDAANLGVQGYGPGQELLVLRDEGLREDPDVVLLAFCLRNDFADAVLPVDLYNGASPRPVFRLEGDRLVLDDSPVRRSPLGQAAGWLADHSHLFNRAAELLPSGDAGDEVGWRYRKREALRDPARSLRLCTALVVEMSRLCRARGVTFLVATFPNGLSYEMETRLAASLQRALEEAGLPVVDMAARFRASGARPADLAIDRTGHLSARGHALAAEILEREIAAQRGL